MAIFQQPGAGASRFAQPIIARGRRLSPEGRTADLWLMSNRIALLGISILAIFLGADTLHTGRGSHVFGWRSRSTPLGDLHYTGPFATLEGLGFIAGGVYGLYRGTRKDLESDD